ncbi:MAG: aminotransferase class V-fold PLP-dependent enzyme [Ignavibacteriae bacterium]|nr:aminotransferase class V-fold PLP-dependent enzyme [Ignavibacteriota bacterium]
MDRIFFTVGPTEVFPEVGNLYNEAFENKLFSISHRSKEFERIFQFTVSSLKELLGIPEDFYIFFISSATECMERVIENLVEKESFHFVNGYFAKRFYNISAQLKKNPKSAETAFGTGYDFGNVFVPDSSEIVCITQNETSTGVAIPTDMIYTLKNRYPDKLFVIDAVTSVPYTKFKFDLIDAAFFSVQKGFGMPPGLGVLIVNRKCIAKAQSLADRGFNTGSYNNFLKLALNADKSQTTITPNIPAIYVLGKICDRLCRTGIETIREEIKKRANLAYNFFDKHNSVRPFVKEKTWRSDTTIVLDVDGDTEKIMYKLAYNGLIVSEGYGEFKGRQIRIGNFPVHSAQDYLNLIYNFRKI